MTGIIIRKILSSILNEANGELKSSAKNLLETGFHDQLSKTERTKNVQNAANKILNSEDSLDLQSIDVQGLIESADEISIKAKVIPIALTTYERKKAEYELRNLVYNKARCRNSDNDLLDSFIRQIIEVADRELSRKTDDITRYPVAKVQEDLEKSLSEKTTSISQEITSAKDEIKDLIQTTSVQDVEYDKTQHLISTFYETAISKLTSPNYDGGELFGYEPLNDVYITPYIMVEGRKTSIFDYIEKSFSYSNNNILIIYGEPGQGKTSLCWKAVYEHKVNGWLNNRFKNIFRFSLNAASFNIDDTLPLYYYHLLETYLKINGVPLSPECCKDSLIFLDGFDELYDNVISKPLKNFSMEYFLRNVLFNSLSAFTGSYFIITSRKMCIEHELKEFHSEKGYTYYTIAGINSFGICKMDSADQDSWISSYEDLIKNRVHDNEKRSSEIEDFRNYIEKLKTAREDSSIKALLEISILFRMVIHFRFLPKVTEKSYNRANMYDLLFHETLMRHGGDEFSTRLAMEHLAFSIFMDNDDSANLSDLCNQFAKNTQTSITTVNRAFETGALPSWLHSYYTMYSEKKKRVLFLHRSFYQYFLACFIYRSIKNIDEQNIDIAELSYLGRRRVSQDVFDYLHQLLEGNDIEDLSNKGIAVINILSETDAILSNDLQLKEKYNVATIDQAGNVFCNCISALSTLNLLPKDALNITLPVSEFNYMRRPLINCLKRYSAQGIIINGAEVNGDRANSNPYFINAILTDVDFSNADFKGTDFSRAYLKNANFKNTDLRGVTFSDTHILIADFDHADLRGATINNVYFNCANFFRADLRGACFSNVTFGYNNNLLEADFRGVSFLNVTFESYLDLDGVDFRGASFSEVNMADSIADKANFRGASYSNSVFSCQIQT